MSESVRSVYPIGERRPPSVLTRGATVSAYQDHTLMVWNVKSALLLATLTCGAAAMCCTFINDRKLIAGDTFGRVHFLRLEELEPNR